MHKNIHGQNAPGAFWMASQNNVTAYNNENNHKQLPQLKGKDVVLNDQRRTFWAWLWLVLVVAILVRLTIWAVYPLAQGNDTPTYLHLASSLKNNNGFERYNGTRTPGYPIFLMLAGTPEHVYVVQLCLGLLTTLMVFYIAWRISRRAW